MRGNELKLTDKILAFGVFFVISSPKSVQLKIERGGRVVEGARLESVYTSKGYRGFESLPLCLIFIFLLYFFYIFNTLTNKIKI
tara:strand:+ start:22853 stop:23104 length:252 start_codon:yes stop_codon:yes gene_type:complete